LPILLRIMFCILLLTGSGFLRAEEPKLTRLDLAVTYIGERSVKANTSENFWMQGGSIELGANFKKLLTDGMRFRFNLVLPSDGDEVIRFGVHDAMTDHIGTLELSANTIRSCDTTRAQ
jgi:hypothetical protein